MEINFILSVLLVAQIQSTIMHQSFVALALPPRGEGPRLVGKYKVCQVFTFGFSRQCRVNAEFLLLHQKRSGDNSSGGFVPAVWGQIIEVLLIRVFSDVLVVIFASNLFACVCL